MATIPIDIPYFREKLIRDQRFLRDLYEGSVLARRRILAGANDLHLHTLIDILHLVYHHAIPITPEHGQMLISSKKLPLLKKHFNKNSDFVSLQNSNRSDQLKILNKLISVYQLFLAPLFEFN